MWEINTNKEIPNFHYIEMIGWGIQQNDIYSGNNAKAVG